MNFRPLEGDTQAQEPPALPPFATPQFATIQNWVFP